MSFDSGSILLAAVLVIVPAVFAVITVKHHVSKFMRDVEAEEQASMDSGKDKSDLPEQTGKTGTF